MHCILYRLNPQTNTQKQKLLREEMNPKQKWTKKNEPKKNEELKLLNWLKLHRRCSDLTTRPHLSPIYGFRAPPWQTATTTRSVLLHEGEGGSVSEWEWRWGWDVSESQWGEDEMWVSVSMRGRVWVSEGEVGEAAELRVKWGKWVLGLELIYIYIYI